MRIDAHSCGPGWFVIDAATGREDRYVIWADDARKEIGRYARERGAYVVERDPTGGQRIKIVIESMRAVHIDAQKKMVKYYRK